MERGTGVGWGCKVVAGATEDMPIGSAKEHQLSYCLMWAGTETSTATQIATNLDQSEVMLYSVIYKIHYRKFRIYTFCRLVVVVVGSINSCNCV